MSEGRIVLYTDAFWISPYAFTCFVGLHEKGVAFETRNVALQDREQQRDDYQARTVTGRVPAIEHDGFWLAESSAIVDYLDDVFPAPAYPALLPADPRQRARARQILGWIRSDLLALRDERATTTMFYDRATTPLSAAGEQAADKLVRVAEQLVRPGAQFLFDRWSIADADLAFMLHRLLLNGHDVPDRLRAFAEAEWARPSVRGFVQRERPPYVPY